MKITSFTDEPIAEVRFLNAGRGPGGFYVDRLPIHVAETDGLPADLDGVIAAADLQGRERLPHRKGLPPRLLGEVLPNLLCAEFLPELGLEPSRTGVILAGDFYTVPALDKRGGSGDVTNVWRAFADNFRWAAGEAGNHDLFGESIHPSVSLAANAYYLDVESVSLDEMQIAGVGGIIGNTRRPHRKTEQAYLESIEFVVEPSMNLLVLHDGPDWPELRQRGTPSVRELLQTLPPVLVVRGHAHWNTPFVELTNGTQVLNVDCRVSIIRRTRK